MIEQDTRLRAGRGIGKTETEASVQALSMLKRHSHSNLPPALASDGWGGHREALVEVYGQIPAKKAGRGRPPSRKQPGGGWHYLQLVKQRENSRVVGVEPQVIYGHEAEVRSLLAEHTAYVERTHLTSRHMNGRLVRKTLGFSKKLEMFGAASIWEDVVYNFARPVKTLRLEVHEGLRRWQRRSPAMAAGLTDHIWTIEALLIHVLIPNNNQ